MSSPFVEAVDVVNVVVVVVVVDVDVVELVATACRCSLSRNLEFFLRLLASPSDSSSSTRSLLPTLASLSSTLAVL